MKNSITSAVRGAFTVFTFAPDCDNQLKLVTAIRRICLPMPQPVLVIVCLAVAAWLSYSLMGVPSRRRRLCEKGARLSRLSRKNA